MRVLLVEDHPLFARALRDEIVRLAPGCHVTLVGSVSEVVKALVSTSFDLVLADLNVPGATGLSLLRTIRNQCDTRVAVISATDSPEVVREIFDERAVGFISKATSNEGFSHALYLILAGGSHFPDLVYTKVETRKEGRALTSRERSVMRLIVEGKQNKEIAKELALGIPTVKSHVKHIYAKLGVRSRVAASIKAGEAGIVPDVRNGR
ncbi:response regulator transcription factor [Paraburkholderia sp. Tr-20389]|uniref:response regulator transcription factor n=1 Tax=Paraburkholderia sp. Tr-20389 TaxID=2703903 RepID=UPI0019811FE8|nr:response regulator transcription factor [Paraburkholderia sp. Tr-20389]MBN3753665.1 response regulator transcription factor [Paraburkholderia sp. Tr-20389]